MANYVLVYKGGRMPEGAAEREASMAAWGAWLGALDDSIVDAGNPFSSSATVATDGTATSGGASALTGYTVISADSIEDASAKTKGCPALSAGGSLEVYEIYPVM